MKTYGHLPELKDGLKDIFRQKTDELDNYYKVKKKEIEDIFDQKLKEINEENDQKLKEHLENLRERMEYNKELETRKSEQQKKEELINKVIEELKTDAEKVTHSKKYLDFIKKRLPKGSKIFADSDYYKSVVGSAQIDDSILGVRAEHGNVVYDFTILSMINSNIERMREEVAKELFK